MLWIFGDSFSASNDIESWVNVLGVPVRNFASNGSSEYRILKNYYAQQDNISATDSVLFVHTSPTRIYLKDDRTTSSRQLESHPTCDIIINDVFEKKEKEYIKVLETIWDEDYFSDTFNLIVDKLQTVPNSKHITANPGNVNHMDKVGNLFVADTIRRLMR